MLVLLEPVLWSSEAVAQQADTHATELYGTDQRTKGSTGHTTEVESLLKATGHDAGVSVPEQRTFQGDTGDRVALLRVLSRSGPVTPAFLELVQANPSSTPRQVSSQTPEPAPTTAKKKRSKLVWILVAAAGVGTGAALAMKGKGGSNPSSSGNPGNPGIGGPPVVTIGPPTVGAP
jgi:hypothetical protein